MHIPFPPQFHLSPQSTSLLISSIGLQALIVVCCIVLFVLNTLAAGRQRQLRRIGAKHSQQHDELVAQINQHLTEHQQLLALATDVDSLSAIVESLRAEVQHSQ